VGLCQKQSSDPMTARRARLTDRCEVCSNDSFDWRCPIGSELKCLAYNVVGYSIQVVRDRTRQRDRRWMVAGLFCGVRRDRRFPVQFFRRRVDALAVAFEYGLCLTGGPIEPWCDGWLAGPTPGRRVPIMVAE
jgi:hypothetical protein